MLRLLALSVGLLLLPVARAQDDARPADARPTDVLLRMDGDVRVAAGDTATATGVIGGDAVVDGVVREGLLVVDGRAVVRGAVEGPVVVVGGHLDLAPRARVRGDVVLIRSTLTRAPGAAVGGEVLQERGVSFGPAAAWFLWLSATFAVLVSGLAFVFLFGARAGIVEAAARRPGASALAALVLVPALPAVAVVSFMTGVGVALGFGVLLVLIPLLGFVGYLTSGVALGEVVLERLRHRPANPYAAAALGLGVLQLLLAVPFVGGLALLAGPFGAGAGLYSVWRRRQGAPSASPAARTSPPATSVPPVLTVPEAAAGLSLPV